MNAKRDNTLIGRRCVINFACRLHFSSQNDYTAQELKKYQAREDWNKTGEIVSFDPKEHLVHVLRDDDGSICEYYKGEVTITGPAVQPEDKLLGALSAILGELSEIKSVLKASASERQPFTTKQV